MSDSKMYEVKVLEIDPFTDAVNTAVYSNVLHYERDGNELFLLQADTAQHIRTAIVMPMKHVYKFYAREIDTDSYTAFINAEYKKVHCL